MDKLTYELKSICKHNRDGSHATQADRLIQLKMIAAQLKKLGFRNLGVRSLRTKHVNALVSAWSSNSENAEMAVSAGTIKNRMAALRWWANKVNKQNVIPRTNRELGIQNRERLPQTNKAYQLSTEQLAALPHHLRFSARLQQAFGLRREEAAKFIPGKAISPDHIQIHSTWAKGGRARQIPITTHEQRVLLNDLVQTNQNASLIPPHMNYRQYLSHRDHFLRQAEIKNSHGLRHHYAQQRYIVVSGGMLPPRLGGKRPGELSPQEQAIDQRARLIVSNELGHARLDITRIYLG